MAFKVYFAQHGLAVDKTENPERPLSAEGIKQTGTMASALRTANIPVSSIFHSGKLRTSQTAEIFAEALGISQTDSINGLAPNDDVTILAPHLQDQVLYIGHLPHLEKLVVYLINKTLNDPILKFNNSAVACLGKNENLYQLQWYFSPGTR